MRGPSTAALADVEDFVGAFMAGGTHEGTTPESGCDEGGFLDGFFFLGAGAGATAGGGGFGRGDGGAEAVGAGDGERAVADGEADALGGSGADITGGEHARDGGFERAGVAVGEGPESGVFGIGAGEEVAEFIAADILRQESGLRLRADEDEDGFGIEFGVGRAVAVGEGEALDAGCAVDFSDFGVDVDFDVGGARRMRSAR